MTELIPFYETHLKKCFDTLSSFIGFSFSDKEKILEQEQFFKKYIPITTQDLCQYLKNHEDLIENNNSYSSLEKIKKGFDLLCPALFKCQFDKDYYENLYSIHNSYFLSSLPLSGIMASYGFLLNSLSSSLMKEISKAEQRNKVLSALQKIIFVDLELSLAIHLALKKEQAQTHKETLLKEIEKRFNDVSDKIYKTVLTVEEMSSSLAKEIHESSKLASLTEQVSSDSSKNVQGVAHSTETLSQSLKEINLKTSASKEISEKASQEAYTTDTAIKELIESTNKVGEIVRVIDYIASQTKLLALNATIEAARSGPTGKGFAVVANEVKSLSTQTEKATGEIRRQINHIQEVTSKANQTITTINTTVKKMDTVSSSILSEVEHQTKETQAIAEKSQQVAENASHIFKNLETINEAIKNLATSSNNMNQVTSSLREGCQDLKNTLQDVWKKIENL